MTRSLITLHLISGVLANTSIINVAGKGIPLFWLSTLIIIMVAIYSKKISWVAIRETSNISFLILIFFLICLVHILLERASKSDTISQLTSRSMLIFYYLSGFYFITKNSAEVYSLKQLKNILGIF